MDNARKIAKAYKIITWKGGKPLTLKGKPLPMGKAKKKGVREVLGTLRASFKLEPSGTTLEPDISYELPRGFTRSKMDMMRFVQPKEQRIKAKTEITEILKAQKFGKGRRKFKWF